MYIFKKESIRTSLQNHLVWLEVFKLVVAIKIDTHEHDSLHGVIGY
jgi:hypothetical protein